MLFCQTRAIRKALTPAEKNAQSIRQQKAAMNFSHKRVYAVKA